MTNKKIKVNILDEKQIQKTLIRLSHEIIEKNSNLENLAIVGIRTRGDIIAKRIHSIIKDISKVYVNLIDQKEPTLDFDSKNQSIKTLKIQFTEASHSKCGYAAIFNE